MEDVQADAQDGQANRGEGQPSDEPVNHPRERTRDVPVVASLRGDPPRIILVADAGNAVCPLAGHTNTAGEQVVTFVSADRFGLSGE